MLFGSVTIAKASCDLASRARENVDFERPFRSSATVDILPCALALAPAPCPSSQWRRGTLTGSCVTRGPIVACGLGAELDQLLLALPRRSRARHRRAIGLFSPVRPPRRRANPNPNPNSAIRPSRVRPSDLRKRCILPPVLPLLRCVRLGRVEGGTICTWTASRP